MTQAATLIRRIDEEEGRTNPKMDAELRRAGKRAAKARWQSVKEEHELWMTPFYQLPIEEAMSYLEDLRRICEEGGTVMNDRIGKDPKKMRCSGVRCGKDLSGTTVNGRPKWIAKKDIRDKEHPEIIRSVYFCSEICHNSWVREQQGAMGGDGK